MKTLALLIIALMLLSVVAADAQQQFITIIGENTVRAWKFCRCDDPEACYTARSYWVDAGGNLWLCFDSACKTGKKISGDFDWQEIKQK